MGRAALVALVLSGCHAPSFVAPDDGGASSLPDAPLGDANPDAMIDAPPDASPSTDPTIVLGAPARILLRGTVITPAGPIEGAVLVEQTLITCVAPGAGCDAMAAGATIIETHAIISPGLIDTHNHVLFDIFDNDDWYPTQVYQDHDEWPNEPRYQAMLDVKQCLVNDAQGKPAWCAQTPYGTSAGSLRCEVDKFGELKGLVAGTTSIVGLPGTSAGCFGSLARSIDVAQNGLGSDHIQTSALFPPSNPSGVCANYATAKTTAFLTHVGEGTDAKALGEFARLGTLTTPDGCLYAPQTAITHGTAFTATEFLQMAAAGTKLIWSPHSNVSLYATTTDIPTALAAGVEVALAPDWSMGGSQNLLEELRFADAWDNGHWNDILTPRDLVTMTTAHAADVLGLQAQLGSIEVGKLADLAVFTGDATKPYDAIVAARPAQVQLVMVGGTVLYGDPLLQASAPATPGCETIQVCTTAKFLCVATASTASKLDQTYAQITTALSDALVLADSLTPTDGFAFAPLTPLVACP